VVAGRRRRERRSEPEGATALESLVTLLARGLGVERVALLVERTPGSALVPAAVHGTRPPPLAPGERPDPESWSLVLPVGPTEGGHGLLLLARPDARPFTPADQALVASVADAIARVLESERQTHELRRAHDLLGQADRLAALGMLAAGVAHEIRNPLVSVRTFIQLLPERLADEEFRTDFRELALGEIERICALINDLLAFSRPAPADREPTDLNELVEQITRLLDAEARKRDVTVSLHSEVDLPKVVVDEAQVKQVLMNVVLNALQACGSHGSVEIPTRSEGDRGHPSCSVTVADSGAGIPPEHAEQIFDPFFTTKDAGSGLGLFIVRQIVTEHGGHITTAARPEGGTAFTIHFPLHRRLADADAV
jgi:signal transduction histidine kinase